MTIKMSDAIRETEACVRTDPWGEEELQVLVKQGLVGGVGQTEALQELVGVLHYLVHPVILILKTEKVIKQWVLLTCK